MGDCLYRVGDLYHDSATGAQSNCLWTVDVYQWNVISRLVYRSTSAAKSGCMGAVCLFSTPRLGIPHLYDDPVTATNARVCEPT